MVWIFTRRGAGALALGLASLLALPKMVLADDPVAVTRAPEIQGKLVLGQTLHAVNGAWTGPADAVENYTWQRCTDEDFEDCSTIAGATEDAYALSASDVGKMMRVTLSVSFGDDSSRKSSELTGVVAAGENGGGINPGLPGTPQDFTLTAPPSKPGPAVPGAKRIKPKPVITLSGRYTSTGAVITRFTVKAPKGATTTLACSKGTCPAKQQTIKGGHTTHLTKFEKKTLKAGTRIQLTVARKGYVSEVSIITIRSKSKPSRSDSCILPGKKTRQKCPA
jgi:hypothetical protein